MMISKKISGEVSCKIVYEILSNVIKHPVGWRIKLDMYFILKTNGDVIYNTKQMYTVQPV
jgi:hypothetical protein